MASEGFVIEHPNRDKASSKAARAIVILLLIVSVVLMIVVSYGGWDKLEGAKQVQIVYCVLYLVFAWFVARWNRGLLPVIAAFAVILAIFAGVSAPGWFARDKAGFEEPALNENIVGLLTYIIVPVQLLLVVFAMRAFSQKWNVEIERRVDRDGNPIAPKHGSGAPAAA